MSFSGYTMENGKAIIWTEKKYVSEPYPFNDEGENHTYFYRLRRHHKEFATCLARITDDEKIKVASEKTGIPEDKIILRSKKSHYARHINKVK